METALKKVNGEQTALVRNALTIDEIRAHVGIIHNVMEKVMQKGTHYGVIPGCGTKPTLLKPGAEKILVTFQLTASPRVENLSRGDEIRYMVTVDITNRDGYLIGSGVGECSSEEEKYKWRKAVCDKEWNATSDDRKRVKYDKWGGETQQVITNPADIANTVLKMAKKRALVDACLTATAASDIFTQDIEDLPEEILNKSESPPESLNVKPEKPQKARSPKTNPSGQWDEKEEENKPNKPISRAMMEGSIRAMVKDMYNESDSMTAYMTQKQGGNMKPLKELSDEAISILYDDIKEDFNKPKEE